MNSKARMIALSAGGLSAVLGLLLAGTLYIVQTDWFRNKVKDKIITSVEQVTGGHVEISSVGYDWRTLTAEFRNCVVHGTERNPARPLFRADSISVKFKITSILKRNMDVASVVVSRPRIRLLVASNEKTNIPVPQFQRVSLAHGLQRFMDLKVRHFEFDQGLVELELRRIPLSFRSEDTSIVLAYINHDQHYDVQLSSQQLQVNADDLWPLPGSLQVDARLERDRLSIQKAVFRYGGSTVRTSGVLQHFVRPETDWQLSASVDASDLAATLKFHGIGGRLTVQGTGHTDENTPFVFHGRIHGRDVSYRIKDFDLKGLNVEADLLAQKDHLELPHFAVGAIGGTMSGRVVLKNRRDLQLDGNLAGLDVHAAAALFGRRDLPWSGTAAGRVHLRAALGITRRDLVLQSNLVIVPGHRGVPLSGEVNASYQANRRILEFARSSLDFPNTHLSFSGIWGADVDVILNSRDLDELNAGLQFLAAGRSPARLPTLLRNGTAHFDGKVTGSLISPQFSGNLALMKFQAGGQTLDQLRSSLVAGRNAVQFSSLIIDQGQLHITAAGSAALQNWIPTNNSAFRLQGEFRGADVVKLTSLIPGLNLQPIRGRASGTIDLAGTILNPRGSAQVNVANLDAYGERLNELQMHTTFAGDTVQITDGRLKAGPADLSFSGSYQHSSTTWRDGQLQVKIDSNGFPLTSLAPIHDYEPGLNGQFEIHAQGAARIAADRFEPLSANGTAALRNVSVNNLPYGSVGFSVGTRGQDLTTSFTGNLRGSPIDGTAQVRLTSGNPAKGQIRVGRIQLSTIVSVIHQQEQKLPFEGGLQGGLTFEGPLQQLSRMHGTISIEALQLVSTVPPSLNMEIPAADLVLRNITPVVLQYAGSLVRVPRFQLKGRGTDVTISGSVPLSEQTPMQLQIDGSADLGLLELFGSKVRASGESLVSASIGGTLTKPNVNGTLELKNGQLSLSNFPNSLTAVKGTLRFAGDRATIQQLTAHTGGGELSAGGFVAFGTGGQLIYRLEANAENVRVRYRGGVSITATSQIRLTGTSENSILSGTSTVSRVIFNPNTDVGNLLASVAAPAASPSNEKDFLTGLQLDIHVESAPNLQVNTELSRDVEAEIDLRLRGTPDRPIVLGNITATSGDIKAFGTKYSINRGEVTFVNAAKIEPVLDLDLQTQARGITVDITVSGTPGKLNINYRSDPPLQPRDIIALLTVGRAPNITSNMPDVSVPSNVSGLQVGADTVLGQAMSPDANRLSKLFGITNIKIDPMVQGITNTPQARLTLEQQISKQISVTYVTNLSQTSEQIFRLEWAFSSQYSLVALRDDNGEFGIDIQYRKRFK